MIIEFTKGSQHNTIKWSGGTTTELAIYPKEASYKDRNFLLRISTAKIKTEASEFTKLKGISRKLMILNGEINIEHKNHYSKTLKKFDQDSFEGDWDTKSFGKAVDFNLMINGNAKAQIEAKTIQEKKVITEYYEFTGIYCYQGELKVNLNDSEFELYGGDFLLIQKDNSNLKIEFLPIVQSEIIITRITVSLHDCCD